MIIKNLYKKAEQKEWLTAEEAVFLFEKAPLAELMMVAHNLRLHHHPNNIVTWIIDRNINYTNICFSGCSFCNFYCGSKSDKAYILDIEEYKPKIDKLFELGGEQILLQGGMNPKLGIDFYTNLFSSLKKLYPKLKLHALGPPEIVHISKKEGISYADCLKQLMDSGLDSLPGAGAEILSDRVREIVSPRKATTSEWLEVMEEAHKLGLVTSATMMFGHVETLLERMQHLEKIREIQNKKPKDSIGFISFIPWPFQDEKTELLTKMEVKNSVSSEEYIRMIAISRMMLPNIENIQPSWLTVGVKSGQLSLYAGANDFGSVMIEEHVVSQAGASHWLTKDSMPKAIKDAGFEPVERNQRFELKS